MNAALLHRLSVAAHTQRLGFHALAAGMAAFCAHEMGIPLSDVRKVEPCQAGTPRGDGSAAVGQSEVLAAGVGNPFPMNSATTTAPADVAGMFARKVAQVTGLSELALDRLHTSDMGAPRHFRYVSGEGGGFFYTADGVTRLVEILHAEGRPAEGAMLARSLAEIRTPAPAPVAPAGRNVRGSWATDWERKQEESAA